MFRSKPWWVCEVKHRLKIGDVTLDNPIHNV